MKELATAIGKTLVVAAHPDDEVLGCAATVARAVSEGADVEILILGEGSRSRGGLSADATREVDSLAAMAHKVGDLLGAARVRLDQLPDNRMDSLDLLDVVKVVEGHVEDFRPQTIFTHFPGDLNIDHGITARAVLTATRPQTGSVLVNNIYAFEVPSSTDWNFDPTAQAFAPNHFVDVSGFLPQKLAAMAIYSGETRAFPHPRSLEALEALARYRGACVGVEAAEAFVVLRQII